jgi:hypothetical protein
MLNKERSVHLEISRQYASLFPSGFIQNLLDSEAFKQYSKALENKKSEFSVRQIYDQLLKAIQLSAENSEMKLEEAEIILELLVEIHTGQVVLDLNS